MDAVAALLDGPRARQAFLLRSSLDPPWAFRIEDEAPLTVVAVTRGVIWVLPDRGTPVRAGSGDVLILRGPGSYVMADDPATPPQVAIGPDQRCRALRAEGRQLADSLGCNVRTWGNTANGSSLMLTGTYRMHGEVSQRLLRALPALVHLGADAWDSPIIPLLAEEIVKDRPGQEAVLDRLLDLLLIAALRAWFAGPDSDPPDWYRASSDPIVGHALRLVHHNPARAWTLADLAREVGISRAALARRFHDLVGEPPIAFLTGWRIALAADLLLEPGATISSVARQVGYSSPFTLSTAFKRLRGVSPQQYRTAAGPSNDH